MANRVRTSLALPARGVVRMRGLAEASTFKPEGPGQGADPVAVDRHRIQLTRNVTNIFRDAPAATVQAGREWYPKAHDEAVSVGRTSGGDVRRGAGIIAAVSPSMSWENNIPAAHQLAGLPDHHIHAMGLANEAQKELGSQIAGHERAAAHAAGGKGPNVRIPGAAPAHLYEQHAAAKRAHMAARSVLVGTPLNGQSTDNIVKAARIRGGEDPESVLPQQKKTGNFYRNVADPSDPHPVTVDTHAHDAARMSKLPFKTDRGLSAVGRYDHFGDAYRNATPRVGETHAHVVQATVWQHWKDRYGTNTSGAPRAPQPEMTEHDLPTGRDRDRLERGIAARSAATVKKRGRPVDPEAQAQGW